MSSCLAHTGPVAEPSGENNETCFQSGLPGLAVHVPDRSANSHRKVHLGRLHMRPYSGISKQLEGTRITRKGDPCPQNLAPPSEMVAGGRQRTSRSTITTSKACSASLYRRIKRRVGHSLKRAHYMGKLVSSGKQSCISTTWN